MAVTRAEARAAGRLRRSFNLLPRDVALVAGIIFVAAIVGTLSRPTGFLAVFWPANALLAGILSREPRVRTIPVVLGAAAAYIVAALILGDSVRDALVLTAGNMVGALLFVAMFGALEQEDRALSRPQGVISLVVMAGAASAAAGVVGGVAFAEISQVDYLDAWMGWFASEVLNYLAILPAVLALPRASWRVLPSRDALSRAAVSVGAVLGAIALSLVVPHPIAIVFPVPALIWCALVQPMAVTTLLVPIYSGIAMLGLKLGLFGMGSSFDLSNGSITATHLTIAFIALGPVVVASIATERRLQLANLGRLTSYDTLTDTLTQQALFEAGEELLSRLQRNREHVAVLIVEPDSLKQLVERHGQLFGDRVLEAIASAIRANSRHGDLLGRVGDEHFGLVLPRVSMRQARVVAEHMRRAVENLVLGQNDGTDLRVTASIGVVCCPRGGQTIAEMVSLAEHAMYEAKRAGRNRVTVREL